MSPVRRASLAWLLLPAIASAQTPYRVTPEVEPPVQEAFAAAWARLPAAHQARLAELGLTLDRAPTLPVPDDAPLALRLMGRATCAWFSLRDDTLFVTDAALGGPRWSGAAPDAAALEPLLRDLAPTLGVEVPAGADAAALRPAWSAFVARCRATFGGEWPAPEESPPGDPRVLDRFLEAGVAASLGGELPSLEALLVHELGHALQLGPKGYIGRVAAWATLSGWVEVARGEPADGFVGGGWANEDPGVLIRLLLGGERGPGATFAPGPGGRFPTLYARFDPREDFAECYRLALTDPAALARSAPEKLLAINALGWCAGVSSPPLFSDAEAPWVRELGPGANRLLGSAPPVPSSSDALAILRAATPLLEGLELEGEATPPFALPQDVPQPVRAAWGGAEEGVALRGRTLYLAGERLVRDLEALFERFDQDVEWAHGIALFRREADPQASFAKTLEGRSGDLALGFLRLLLVDEPVERLTAWLTEADGAQQALVLAALIARRPDDPNYAKAFGQLPPLSPYASALVAELLIEPELAGGQAPEAPSTPAILARHVLRGQAGTTRVAAARARALAVFSRSARAAERAALVDEARKSAAGIALPKLRAKVQAEVEALLAPAKAE
ncbi:MAG: hypothetical protein KDD82_02220 [Planctomycetes bacterium]|nr:hypothetical protein [Planctomycetota bacterium]